MGKEIHQNIIKTIHEIETLSFSSLDCLNTNIHGVQHLRQVAYLSARFANSLSLDYKTAAIAGYLHDCARNNDGDGNTHAHESAYLAMEIIKTNWSNIDADKIFQSIYYHADGLKTDDPFVGCIWDADRLNLIRLGIIPKVELLSNEIARRIHSMFIERNKLFPLINEMVLNIQKQLTETGKAIIGIWYTENSNIILQLILNQLDESFNFDFKQLTIVSLFEYTNTPKYHDQSCCYQIYKSCSNRITIDQTVCPKHDLNFQEITSIVIPCIISYEYPFYPFLNNSIQSKDGINNYQIRSETRNYLSRYYERTTNTPDSIKTFSTDFYSNLDLLIVLIDKLLVMSNNEITNIMPTLWLRNAIKLNTFQNIL